MELLTQYLEAHYEQITIIEPIEEGNYLEGYNLVEEHYLDIDKDGVDEEVELYTMAGIDDEGNLILDDGQKWTLIVRDTDKIYPVFEQTYIQIGELQCDPFIEFGEEEDDDVFRLLISRIQSAGIMIYEATYDDETDTFSRRTIYEAVGNISVY